MGNLPPAGARVARIVAERLASRGERAWIVGGCVRDLALGAAPQDVDMASAAPPDVVAGLFEHTAAVGKAFGTVVVRVEDHDVQVTTFRTERGHSDQRRPDQVAWGRSVEEDAARRDFTCNALYLDPLADELRDPTGGMADIQAGLLRCVGEPAQRFREDGLRLVRLARFAALLDFHVDGGTLAAARAERGALGGVSPERVAAELERILSRPRAERALRMLGELGLLDTLFPTLGELGPERGLRWDVLGALTPAPGFEEGLSVLFDPAPQGRVELPGAPAAARGLLTGLRLSRDQSRAVEELWNLQREALRVLSVDGPARAQRVRLVRAPLWPRAGRVLRAWLEARGESSAGLAELIDFGAALTPAEARPEAFVRSADLAHLDVPRGPRWKELLEEAETLQLDGLLTTRDDALAWLARRAKHS
jgi:tRNA nucleotidyltransferase/poly(A) polymerase